MQLNFKHGSIQAQFKQIVKSQVDSENDSDKTKDTMFQVSPDSFLKYMQSIIQNIRHFMRDFIPKIINICNGTSSSDKIVRLSSTIIKFIKNFQLIIKLTKFDKLLGQITQLRRILRVNRILSVVKQFVTFFKKEKKTGRDVFQIFFKLVMFLCDINDMILYLMQLKVFKQRGVLTLKKNIANLYFFQCMLWVIQHTYDYTTKLNQTQPQIKTRRVNIFKYLLDALVAHNDFSSKLFTIQPKNSSILALFSSYVGIWLIWK